MTLGCVVGGTATLCLGVVDEGASEDGDVGRVDGVASGGGAAAATGGRVTGGPAAVRLVTGIGIDR